MLSHASIKGHEMLFKALLNEDECMHLNVFKLLVDCILKCQFLKNNWRNEVSVSLPHILRWGVSQPPSGT